VNHRLAGPNVREHFESTALVIIDPALPQQGVLLTVGDGRAVEIMDLTFTIMKTLVASSGGATNPLVINVAKENNVSSHTAQGCALFVVQSVADRATILAAGGTPITLTAGTYYRAAAARTAADKAGTTDYTVTTPTTEGVFLDSYWRSVGAMRNAWNMSLGTGVSGAPHKLVWNFSSASAGISGEVEIRALWKYSDNNRKW